MAAHLPSLRLVPGMQFSCGQCTMCCRSFIVPLEPGEAESVNALGWPEGDPLRGARVVETSGGRSSLAHVPGGACVFLDERRSLCRIHERFGAERKPLACRVYPYNLAAVQPGEVTVARRHDCPTVRANAGAPCEADGAALKRYAAALGLGAGPGYDLAARAGLEWRTVEKIVAFVERSLDRFERPADRATFLVYVADWLASLGATFLDLADLDRILPPLVERMRTQMAAAVAGPPAASTRIRFRGLLALYLRRDVDVIAGRASRVTRALAGAAFVMGRGTLRGLGLAHPPAPVGAARILEAPPTDVAPGLLSPLWAFVSEMLRAHLFFGPPSSGHDLFGGLRALGLVYPLVVALARTSRAGRSGPGPVDAADVDYAVGAIAHAFGRAPVLETRLARSFANALLERAVFRGVALAV